MKGARCLAAAMMASASLAWAGDPARVTLKVDGMTCGGCVAAVKVQLKKTEGVTAYEVSLEKGEAEVTYDPAKTDPKKIAASVSKTGFVASVKESPAQNEADAGVKEPTASPGVRNGASCDPDCGRKAERATTAAGEAAAPGLVSMARDMTPLAAAFNAVKDRPRFLAILSPTCSACAHGAEAIKAAVLPAGGAVEVFVVWAPMLEGDGGAAAASSSRILAGRGVRQFWDPERRVGTAFRKDVFPDALERMRRSVPKDHFFARHLATRDGRQPEWDIYLFFEPGLEWTERAPRPSRWMRQTARFRRGESGLVSLMWRNDYASPPVEGSLTEELRKLVSVLMRTSVR